jgi:hypothetical protein
MADAELTLETFRYFIGRLALREPADWLPEAKDLAVERTDTSEP